MPYYDFECDKCGAKEELFLTIANNNAVVPCRLCKNGTLKRLPSRVSIKVQSSPEKNAGRPKVNARYTKKDGFHG